MQLIGAWFFDRVLTTIKKYHMLDMGDSVLVAVSGGPDSVALLYFLKHIEPLYNLRLRIFHLNHEIRGAEADKDAEFVAALAARLDIPAMLESYDVPALMERERLSLEEAAREARYRLMDRLAVELKVDRIALAHHADDQVETFLMRLIRGAGLEGLSAMQPVRGIYIRPFIDVSKEDILGYIRDNELAYRVDASNEDLSILRNRVRSDLVPLLASYNPQFKGSILKTIEIVREDQSHLSELTDGVFDLLAEVGDGIVRIQIQAVEAQPVSLKRRLIRKCIKWAKADLRGIEFKHVEAILDALQNVPVRFELELPGGVIVFTEYEHLVFARKQLFEGPPLKPVRLIVPGITPVEPLGIEIETQYHNAGDIVFEGDGDVAHLDADKLPEELEIRTRKPGDFFVPFGMMGEKKLQDFFVDEKVPRRQRDKVPIVTANDHIVWVVGFRIDERFRVTAQTKRVLVLRLKPQRR